jgi:small-conductance mechanosensitive channel
MATDTDITALIERLRKVKAETAREAVAALETLQADNADLRGLLAETVPDPEYRKMQDDEIERLRDALEAMQNEIKRLTRKFEDRANYRAEEADFWKARAEKGEPVDDDFKRLREIGIIDNNGRDQEV